MSICYTASMNLKKSTLKQSLQKGKKNTKSTIIINDFEKLLKKAVSTRPFSPKKPRLPEKVTDQT